MGCDNSWLGTTPREAANPCTKDLLDFTNGPDRFAQKVEYRQY